MLRHLPNDGGDAREDGGAYVRVSPLGWWGFGAEGEPSRSVSVSLLGWAIA